MNITKQVGDFIYNTQKNSLPEDIYKKTLIHFIDSLWCYFWSFNTELWEKHIQVLTNMDVKWWIHVLWTKKKLSNTIHSFFSAWMINACDFDDTSISWGHPWATVIWTAITICIENEVQLTDLLKWINCWYDVINCIKKWTEPSWERYNKVHWIWTSQAFWSFAVASCLYKMSKNQIITWLWLAWAFSPVPHACKYWWNTNALISIKDNVAIASQNWLQAAILSKLWFVGSDSIFDWEDSFYIMAWSDKNDLHNESILLWKQFSIAEASIKPYPCCRWIHTILDAINNIINETEDFLENIDSIKIEAMPSLINIFNNNKPSWVVEWQFSIQHNIALLLLWTDYNKWNYCKFNNNSFNYKLDKIRNIIFFEDKKEYQEEYLSWWKDPSNIPVSVSINYKNGIEKTVEIKKASWSKDNPLDIDKIKNKFILNCKNANIDWEILFDKIISMKPNDNISSLLKSI